MQIMFCNSDLTVRLYFGRVAINNTKEVNCVRLFLSLTNLAHDNKYQHPFFLTIFGISVNPEVTYAAVMSRRKATSDDII